MNGGIIAFIVGVILFVGSYLFGRRKGVEDTETRISGDITIARRKAVQAGQEADIASGVADAVSEAVSGQTEARSGLEGMLESLDRARDLNDRDTMYSIAQKLAEKAVSKGASE